MRKPISRRWIHLVARGEAAFAIRHGRHALDMVRGTGHQIERSVLGWLTTVLLWRGRWSEAIDSSARSSPIAANSKSTRRNTMDVRGCLPPE